VYQIPITIVTLLYNGSIIIIMFVYWGSSYATQPNI